MRSIDKSGKVLYEFVSSTLPNEVVRIGSKVVEAFIEKIDAIGLFFVDIWKRFIDTLKGSHNDGISNNFQCFFNNLRGIDDRSFNYLSNLLSRLFLGLHNLLFLLLSSLKESRVIGEGFLVHIENCILFCDFLENCIFAINHIFLLLSRNDFFVFDFLSSLVNLLQLLLFVP